MPNPIPHPAEGNEPGSSTQCPVSLDPRQRIRLREILVDIMSKRVERARPAGPDGLVVNFLQHHPGLLGGPSAVQVLGGVR